MIYKKAFGKQSCNKLSLMVSSLEIFELCYILVSHVFIWCWLYTRRPLDWCTPLQASKEEISNVAT